MICALKKWMIFFFIPLISFSYVMKPFTIKGLRHPFYVSVTEINQNSAAKTLEISCKFFSDDLEQIIEKDYKAQLDITLEKDKDAFNKYIPDYISKHFLLTINAKLAAINYVGFEKEKESAYAYFEVKEITDVKTINVTNNLLYDFIDQEINIMHITVMGKRQSTKLDYPNSQASFSF